MLRDFSPNPNSDSENTKKGLVLGENGNFWLKILENI